MQSLTQQQFQALQRGQQKLSARQLSEALAIAKDVVRGASKSPDALQFLGICLAEDGQFGAAESAFLKALEFAPGNPLLLTNLAALYSKGGKTDAAIQNLRKVLSRSPEFPRAWQELGRCLLSQGRYEEATESLERAVRLQPRSLSALQALGRARRGAEDYEGAAMAWRQVLTLAPRNGVAWTHLGAVYRLMGLADQSLECYHEALKCGYQGPDLADARVGALLDLGQAEEALVEARRVVQQHPQFIEGQRTLAHLLWEYGVELAPGEDPLDRFRAAAKQGNRELQLAYAQFLLETRRPDEALQRFDALRAEADHPSLKTMAANAHEQLGQSVEAGSLYAKAYPDLSNDPGFLCSYARHLLKAGEWARARDLSAHAVAIAPDNQEAWAYLGTAWRLLGDEREHWLCDYNQLISFHEVPPPDGYKTPEDFLDTLKATLEPMHQARREPVQQSLRGGSQTPGRLFGRADPVLRGLQQSLTATIEDWLAQLAPQQNHPFYRRLTPTIRYTGSWSVKLWSSGRHVNHIHPEGWISSAYYVALPPSVLATDTADSGTTSAGAIQFGQPPDELGLGLEPRRVIQPKAGYLALFPSYLWHGTVPFTDQEPRMTIAFDMRPWNQY